MGENRIMAETREERPAEAKWDVESLYSSLQEWRGALEDLLAKSKSGWEGLLELKGKLSCEKGVVKKCFDLYFQCLRELEKVFTYAHLRHDEDIGNKEHKEAYERALALYHTFGQQTSWIEPEILHMGEKELTALSALEELAPYKFYLEKLRHQQKHVLSADKEEMLSLNMRLQMVPKSTFSALSNADMVFPNAVDKEGGEHPLTHGSYSVYMKSKDRALRKSAFLNLHNAFGDFENTLAELLAGHVQGHIFNQKVRHYGSSLEASLHPHNIPITVYYNLIDTVKKHLPVLHEYIALRKKVLGVDKLHIWDMSVPIVEHFDKKYAYEEACNIVIEAIAPLGKEYQKILAQGLTKDRWVDVFESKGKRSGAYSSGCYDSLPYILMNFQGMISDVLTLSHEAGHSMNTLLSNRKQAYHNASYPIFVAEVASTFHERLTYEHLIEKAGNAEEKAYILNQQIEGMRSTFFRQTMFAEFELLIHTYAENGVPLTPHLLKEQYKRLNMEYFGPDFIYDEEVSFEFMRIPHFYYNFYVYQYATGIAAAYTLVDQVKKEGVERYLEFLASGGSNYPIELLKRAGVDMNTPHPIESFIAVFKNLIERLGKVL